jgi:hypothetical protein
LINYKKTPVSEDSWRNRYGCFCALSIITLLLCYIFLYNTFVLFFFFIMVIFKDFSGKYLKSRGKLILLIIKIGIVNEWVHSFAEKRVCIWCSHCGGAFHICSTVVFNIVLRQQLFLIIVINLYLFPQVNIVHIFIMYDMFFWNMQYRNMHRFRFFY